MISLNKCALVVEGTNDVSYLSSFIGGEIVSDNGLEVKKDTVEYLKELEKVKKIIILTDPDEAGEKIATKIRKELSNYEIVNVDITKCTRSKKNGIAECDKDEILSKLSGFLQEKPLKTEQLLLVDIENIKGRYHVGNQDICNEFHLGNVNTKTMIKRLNALELSLVEIENRLNKKYGNK